MRNFAAGFFILALLLFSAGCGPTYPKEKLAESVIKICRDEYKADIKASVIGKTLAIYIPLPALFDITLAINEKAQDTIQGVILSASRVVLSTDAGIEFYCIIAQDIRIPEIQIMVIKYVDDVKRAFFSDVSRDEYFKRTLFDININPQSRKEQVINKIFEKYSMEESLKKKVIEEFFRSTPVQLEDFGYWEGRFYVKDITLPEFIAEQIAYRIKIRFRENKKLSDEYMVGPVDGAYAREKDRADFIVNYDIRPHEILTVMGRQYDRKALIENIFMEVSDCVYGYKFRDFSLVKIFDKAGDFRFFISKDQIYEFKKGRMGINDILSGMQY